MAHVFILYAHEDIDFAELLTNKLKEAGLVPWVDGERLRAGKDWRIEIDLAIENSCALIVIITPDAKNSEYVTYEWSFALGAKKTVIPIIRKVTELHSRLKTFQYLNFTDSANRPWNNLIDELKLIKKCTMPNDLLRGIVPDYLSDSLKQLYSSDKDARMKAIEVLANIKDTTAHEVLAQAMQFPEQDVRIQAAFHLAEATNNTDTRAFVALLEALGDNDSKIRAKAAWLLGAVGGNTALPELINALNDPDSDVRSHVAGALGEIGHKSAVADLVQLLSDKAPFSSLQGIPYTGVNVSDIAAQALTRIGTPEALAAVEQWQRQQRGDRPETL